MKNRYVLAADLPLIAVAAFGAFVARFDLLFFQHRPEFRTYLLAALLIKPVIFLLSGMYGRYWRYASIQELAVVVIGVTAASVGMAIFVTIATNLPGYVIVEFSRVVLFNDWILTLALAGGLRLGIRIVHESKASTAASRGTRAARAQRILVVGAGAAGTMVAREMRRNPQLRMHAAGFLDDDKAKVGKRIAGLRVLAETKMLPQVVRSNRIDLVVVAMPTASGRAIREVVEMCHEVGVRFQTIPGVFEVLGGRVSINRLRNVDIADLLRRSPIDGTSTTANFVAGRAVLITGGGGSIGYELARQIADAGPSHLVLLGRGENSIFEAEARLRAAYPQLKLSSVIADVRDENRLATVFDRIKPAIVFHAAAHKHVPLMEENPEEAVTNNITGTRNVVRQALRTATERFVLISTDKAVSPTSVMGASKRIAEAIVRDAAQRSGRALVVVRFGNVLGSRGSVVNTFKQQIEQGGPITVTDAEMTRYFMTIPEAVHLVLEASGNGHGGELFVLDMGQPVKIVDLARDLIKLSGLTEDDVPITFSGIRPGEKRDERLFEPDARTAHTWHPDILQIVEPERLTGPELDALVSALEAAAAAGDRRAVNMLLGQAFPDLVSTERMMGPAAAIHTTSIH